MPRLAGSYDLTSDPRVDMQIAQSIGGAIESGLRNHRIRQEEARKQHLNATLVQTLGRTIKDGVTDPGKILEALESVPDYAESEWYQQMVMAEAQRRMTPTQKYGALPGYFQQLTPEQQQEASRVAAGLAPRAVVERPPSVSQQQWDLLTDEQKQRAAQVQAGLSPRATVERPPTVSQQQWDLLTDEQKAQAAKVQAGLAPRVGAAVNEPKAVLSLWEKRTGIEADLRQAEAEIEQGYWVDNKGNRQPVTDADRQRAVGLKRQLQIIDDQLSGTEYGQRQLQAYDRATQAVERGKQVIEIGEQFPIKPFIDKIPETVKVGKLDKVKSVQAIQDAMVEYANVLVQQYGLTDFEAQREAERQVRLLQEKDGNRFGFREFPEQEIYYPQDRAGSPPAVGQPVGEAGAMTDMIARDRSQVDARQIAGDYFSLMTDILGETGQRPAQAQAQPPAQQQEPRPITQEELASGKYLPAVSPDGQEVYVDTASYEQALGQGYSPITVKSKEEYDSLPSGTVFIAPDGSRRKKP